MGQSNKRFFQRTSVILISSDHPLSWQQGSWRVEPAQYALASGERGTHTKPGGVYHRSTLLTAAADYLMQVCNDTACLLLRSQQTW